MKIYIIGGIGDYQRELLRKRRGPRLDRLGGIGREGNTIRKRDRDIGIYLTSFPFFFFKVVFADFPPW